MSDIASNSQAHPGLDEGKRSIPATWMKPAELVSGHHSNIPAQVHRQSGWIRPVTTWVGIFCFGFGLAAVLRPYMADYFPGSFSNQENLAPSQENKSNSGVPPDVTRTAPDTERHTGGEQNAAVRVNASDGIAEQNQAQDDNVAEALQNGTRRSETNAQAPAATSPEESSVGNDKADKPRRKVSPRVRRRAKKLTKKAKAYISKKRHKSAKRLLEKAIAIDPYYSATYRYLGQTLRKLKDPAGARKAYKKYLTLSPKSRYAPSIRKYLKKQ
jgi:hypothetical protein